MYSEGFDTVWAALVDILSNLNYPIATIDKSSGLIVCEFISIDGLMLERMAFIPRGILGSAYTQGRYKINARVKDEVTHVSVKINTHIEAFQGIFRPYGWEVVESRGVIEHEIISKMDERLKENVHDYKKIMDEFDVQYRTYYENKLNELTSEYKRGNITKEEYELRKQEYLRRLE